MTIEARMADGRILEFPDGTDSQVVQATVKKLFAEKAVQESKLTTDAAATSIEERAMKIYEIEALDGNKYRIQAPDGATKEEAYQALLEQHPEAGIPAKQVGMSMESVALLITSAVVGFGIAFFIERKVTKTLQTKAQKVWLSIAGTVIGLGLMGLLNEFIVIPYSGSTTNFQNVFKYIFFNILVFPVLIGLVIWWLKVKATSVSTDVVTTPPKVDSSLLKTEVTERDAQPAEDLYAKALYELEGGKRIDGVWAKCFAEADGVESVAKAQYIRIRVTQLQLLIDQSIRQKQESEKINVELDQASKSNLSPDTSDINLFKYVVVGLALTLLTVFGTLYGSGFFQDNKKKEQVKALQQLEEFEKQAAAVPKFKGSPTQYEKNYFQLEKELMTNITGSKKVMVVQLAVMTHYDTRVFDNIKKHEFALRSAMLDIMRQSTEAEASKPEFRKEMAVKFKDVMNAMLEEYEDFGGIEEVMYTSFELR
jgi:flagellar FliL protein